MWLLGQCGRPQTECRHQCMMLVYNLATLLPGKCMFIRMSHDAYVISQGDGGAVLRFGLGKDVPLMLQNLLRVILILILAGKGTHIQGG